MLVAIGITATVLVAVTFAATTSIKNARISRDRQNAKVLAQQILEDARADRDADPSTFFAQSTHTDELADSGDSPVYSRTVTYTVEDVGKIRVDAEITWTDGDTNLSINQSTYLNQWQR